MLFEVFSCIIKATWFKLSVKFSFPGEKFVSIIIQCKKKRQSIGQVCEVDQKNRKRIFGDEEYFVGAILRKSVYTFCHHFSLVVWN